MPSLKRARPTAQVIGIHVQGLWEREQGLAWTDRELVLDLPADRSWSALRVRGMAIAGIGGGSPEGRSLQLVDGDGVVTISSVPEDGAFSLTFPARPGYERKGRVVLRVFPTATPVKLGLGNDQRRLGLLIASIDADGTPLLDFAVDEPVRFDRPDALPPVVFLGYLRSEMGVGEACRGVVRALRTTMAPLSLLDLSESTVYRAQDDSLGTLEDGDATGPGVAILHVNADQTPAVRSAHAATLESKHVVGVWYWELPRLPRRWHPSFAQVDEIWAPTRFIQDCLAIDAPVPVVHIPPAISVPTEVHPDRAGFGIPEEIFAILCMYDMRSFQQRKNPEGAVLAFCRAFPEPGQAFLVIKVMNAEQDPEALNALRELATSRDDILIVDGILDRDRVHTLEVSCDCLISLHRSEGLGLGLAEMMALGRPVVATGWSGNMDFMDEHNSMPVRYRLVPVGSTVGPYDSGQTWADPDLDHAATCLRTLHTEPDLRQKLAGRAQASIRALYHPEVVGARIAERLRAIQGRSW